MKQLEKGSARGWIRCKNILLRLISICLPFLFLGLVELILRANGTGVSMKLFTEHPGDSSYLIFNPDVSKKYFSDRSLAPVGNMEPFKKHKDPNSIRVFVLGESTTIGYPYFHNASFHRMIQYRLMNTYPDKQIEIINLSLTGVNSYTVLDFAGQLYRYTPDAVAIYVGHNEYYGALGVASTENVGENRWLIKAILALRELRLFQWMTSVYSKFSTPEEDASGSRMKQMVARGSVELGSPLYLRGVEQFRRNLDNTISELQAHDIPVFVSNLVSNERGMKPFVSIEPEGSNKAVFQAFFREGNEALQRGDSAEAYRRFKRADETYSSHALCNYLLGMLSENEQQADHYFERAKDLDGLRFRAPSEFNAIVSQLCSSHSNAYLVDAKAAFDSYSRVEASGSGLFLEHVHPNITGYAVLSQAFYNEMKRRHIFPLAQGTEMSLKDLLTSVPVPQLDSLAGNYRIAALKKSWPFNEVMTNSEPVAQTEIEALAWQLYKKQISWYQAMDDVYRYYVNLGRLDKAEKIVEAMVLENPSDPAYWERTAMINAKIGDKRTAVKYLRRAFDLSPTFEKARYLFVLNLQMDEPFEALPYIDYAMKHNTMRHNLRELKHQVEKIITMEDTLRNNPLDVGAMIEIAHLYVSMDSPEPARKYVNKARELNSKSEQLMIISEKINTITSRL